VTSDGTNGAPTTTTTPVLATLAPSIFDRLPVTGLARAFVVNYTNHNFEGALLDFIHLAVDLSPLRSIGRGAHLTTLGLKGAGGRSGFDFAVGLSGHVEKLASETGSLTYNQIAKTGVFVPENFAAIANQAYHSDYNPRN
jgi:hypothetical protein